MSLIHATHNEEVCRFLFEQKIANGFSAKWADWVITTAFYSALHYVDHEIFPFTDQKTHTTYNNINEYKNDYGQHFKHTIHDARLAAVQKRLKYAHSAFSWLYDKCRDARYYNYNVNPQWADEAITKLNVITNNCTKLKSPSQQPQTPPHSQPTQPNNAKP